MLDGSPVLDIKPYIPRYDSFPDSAAGWVDAIDSHAQFTIEWIDLARNQALWIDERVSYNLSHLVERRLLLNPFPTSSNRIEQIDSENYILSSRAWRIFYSLSETRIVIQKIISAYPLGVEQRIHAELSEQEAVAHIEFLKLRRA